MDKELSRRQWYLPSNTDSSFNTTVSDSNSNKWVANGEHYQFKELLKLKKKYGCGEIADHYDKNSDGDFEQWNANDHKARSASKKAFAEWMRTDEPENYFDQAKTLSEGKVSYSKPKLKVFVPIFTVGLLLLISGLTFTIVAFVKNLSVGIGFASIALLAGGIAISVLAGKKVKKFIEDVVDGKYDAKKFQESLNEMKELKHKMAVVDKKYAPTVEKVKMEYKIIYSTLKRKFGKLVNNKDWKYLDIIIYYFETGRADDMKEALQLLEREIQTERIIGAINNASKRICSEIKVAANMISSQLSIISDQLSKSIALQQTQIMQNQFILNEATMRNALIAKSNVTSEKLMQDVDYIKNYGVKIRA